LYVETACAGLDRCPDVPQELNHFRRHRTMHYAMFIFHALLSSLKRRPTAIQKMNDFDYLKST